MSICLFCISINQHALLFSLSLFLKALFSFDNKFLESNKRHLLIEAQRRNDCHRYQCGKHNRWLNVWLRSFRKISYRKEDAIRSESST